MDNISLYPGAGGDTLAADDIGGAKYQRIKLVHGSDGVNAGDVSAANALPVHVTPDTVFGEVTVAENTPVLQAEFVYGLNTRLFGSATTGSGTVTTANSLLTVNTTAAASSSATVSSRRVLKYRSGVGSLTRFTAMFTTGAANSQQEVGPGTATEGFFVGYNGTAFGICRRRNGSDVWVPQASWNVDPMNGSGPSGMTLDPTKLNVFQIRFQYLGAGAAEWFVENPATGRMVLVHRLSWANQNTTTTVLNPSMPLRWSVANTSNTTAISLSGASVMLALEGKRIPAGASWTASNTKTGVTTEVAVVSVKAATAYNTVLSQIVTDLVQIGIAANGNNAGVATFRLTLNPTLGGSPAFSPLSGSTADNGVTITSGQSSLSADTAGTTVTGGTRLASWVIATGSDDTIQWPSHDMGQLVLAPGDVLTLSAQSTASTTVGGSLTLVENL